MVAMNLFMPGEGISETHVTWHDIETSMQHEFQTKATLGPNRSAKDIGDGKVSYKADFHFHSLGFSEKPIFENTGITYDSV